MTTPTDADLAAWGALAAAATPGPWHTHPERVDVVLASDTRIAICGTVFHENLLQELADAAFIAAAREGWPQCIDALREARADLHSARAMLAGEHAARIGRACACIHCEPYWASEPSAERAGGTVDDAVVYDEHKVSPPGSVSRCYCEACTRHRQRPSAERAG